MAEKEVQMSKQNNSKDLIDMIDFSPVLETINKYWVTRSTNNAQLDIKNEKDWSQILSLAKTFMDDELPHSVSYNNSYYHLFDSGIENVLFYVYLCKYCVAKPQDMSFVLYFLRNYAPAMSEADAKIVFSTFKKAGMIDVLNNMETNPNVFKAVTGVSSNVLINAALRFDEKILNTFLEVTGATQFVNYIRQLQIQKQKELEEEKIREQKEAEEEARLAPIREAERKKREAEEAKAAAEEEARREAAAKKEAEREAKRMAEEAKEQEKRNQIVSARLLKLAENFNKGHYKFDSRAMRVRFANSITKEDIARLPKTDAGVVAMFGALVNMSTQIKTLDELRVFDSMLKYMSKRLTVKDCLRHVSMAEILAIVGLSKEDLNQPGKSANAIAHYREVMNIINKYPTVFKDGFGIDLYETPHDLHFSIEDNDYSNGIELALRKAARKRNSNILRAAADKTRKLTNSLSNIIYRDGKKEH